MLSIDNINVISGPKFLAPAELPAHPEIQPAQKILCSAATFRRLTRLRRHHRHPGC
ncbi:hypothetical protein GGI64_000751 [Rhizobium leguminosarum]|uniref:Uncharacterized protein n=1 Tax=Rhizobium leguminosarum TaxID=384 RepID=A0A7Z0DUR0_RHILE|nr:hypothetical protein [Rhizobium leguminosarum]NYJ09732.1 hypothetical protein [Rhizobium leguminosarum]